jgi:hypothetical protein
MRALVDFLRLVLDGAVERVAKRDGGGVSEFSMQPRRNAVRVLAEVVEVDGDAGRRFCLAWLAASLAT